MDDRSTPTPAPDGDGFGYAPKVATQRTSASGFLLDAARRRRLGRVLISGLTALLFLSGAGMFSYPFFTDLYTNNVLQDRLEDEFSRVQAGSIEDWQASLETGGALTRIVIPAIDVDMLVVEGTSPAALRAGAGHYPNTPLPGQAGNVGIAGHRTTYGRPFNRVDELEPGDDIWLLTPVGDFRYVVSEPDPDIGANPWVTHPEDWGVVAPSSQPLLTLTTCHPKGSAAQRMIVRAQLAASEQPGSFQAERAEQADAA